MSEEGRKLIAYVGPMLKDLNTFLSKAVPDTKLTIKKYQDAKFEFLAYCLKVKELDDEEYEFAVSTKTAPIFSSSLSHTHSLSVATWSAFG